MRNLLIVRENYLRVNFIRDEDVKSSRDREKVDEFLKCRIYTC